MSWADHASKMHAAVDDRLGDVISLAVNGVTFVDVKGFVIWEVEGSGLTGLDEVLGSRPRIKLKRSFFGGAPAKTVRLRCTAKLGAFTFRPGNADPDEQGDYVIFDIQKV